LIGKTVKIALDKPKEGGCIVIFEKKNRVSRRVVTGRERFFCVVFLSFTNSEIAENKKSE
jgi:hypothetical protein